MFKFGNPLMKVVSHAEFKLRSFLNGISHQIGASVFSATSESADGKSAKLFYLLNLIFFISLIVLSPDKITQELSPIKLGYTTLDGFQDVAELLRNLVPF